MAIIQISKIQARSGDLVDLPQLDNAELGWASDVKKLYIGKTDPAPVENVEVLTSYSNINFSQIAGSEGNLNITAAVDGQVLSYDGQNWVNKGGDAGGLITLGDVGNVKITGGVNGYFLQTDGTGNLNWTAMAGSGNGNPGVSPYIGGNAVTNTGGGGGGGSGTTGGAGGNSGGGRVVVYTW